MEELRLEPLPLQPLTRFAEVRETPWAKLEPLAADSLR
jgi:hypothetical protein